MHAQEYTEVTVEILLQQGVKLLAASSGSAALDSELLLAEVLGFTRTALYIRHALAVTPEQQQRFMDLVQQRATQRPLAQILGRREFWSLDLQVSADTLVPRPDTELLVDRALHHLPKGSAQTVLDLGTGTGAIALAISKERPDTQITAVDVSRAALAIAQQNGARLAPGRIQWLHGDWYAALNKDAAFDLLVANPPYVCDGDPRCNAETRWEPALALYSGPDGLDAIRKIVAGAPAHLRNGGHLLLEHALDQADAVAALMYQAGFIDVCSFTDIAGHPRVTEGRLAAGGHK